MTCEKKMLFGVHFGHFLADFCCFFGACQERKHFNLQWFCAFGMEEVYFLQHAENCVNTIVFCQAKKHIVDRYHEIATRSKKDRKCFVLPENIGIYGVFAPRVSKKTQKHQPFDDFRPLRD